MRGANIDSDLEKPSDASLDDRLEVLYRENVKLSEEISHIIEGKSDDMNLLDSIKVLQGLREASEDVSLSASQSGVRSISASAKQRGTAVPKRKSGGASSLGHDGADDDGSAAPSPRVSGGRLTAGPGAKDKQRGSSAQPSIASTREVSVKIEDGAESVASSDVASAGVEMPSNMSANGSSGSVEPANRVRLTLSVGAMVYYRNKGRAQEGEGILCRVTNVIGEGKQRRYEIQDADPDPGQAEGQAPYRASVSHLVPIPMSNVGLQDLPKGKNVLAQYPDTTTFYKAEVSTMWKAKDIGTDKGDLVRLRFEGETEDTKEQEVERRFVLVEK